MVQIEINLLTTKIQIGNYFEKNDNFFEKNV